MLVLVIFSRPGYFYFQSVFTRTLDAARFVRFLVLTENQHFTQTAANCFPLRSHPTDSNSQVWQDATTVTDPRQFNSELRNRKKPVQPPRSESYLVMFRV